MTSDEALLASVLDHLPLGVWIARVPGGELVHANQVFREIMGIEARHDVAQGGYSEPYGICTREGTPYPEDGMPFVRAVQARAIVTVDDIVIHRPDGGRVNIRAHARPIFDGDTITHVVIAFVDITAEIRAEAARRESEERLRAAQRLEAVGNLAAGIAHDFNNAMASIRALAALLRLGEEDPARVEDLRMIEDATDRAAQLTRALLTFGRKGAGKVVRVSVDGLARTVVDLVHRTFDRQIEIHLDAAPDTWVKGDPGQLEQLLMNLLVNARDVMPDGGRIDVRVSRDGRWVLLEVADSGPGIPRELRSRVFEPYFTTKQLGDRAGTGLGLATVYGIIQQHGGSIRISDVLPHGARFEVRLPAIGSEVPRVPAEPEPPLRFGQGRILLVEDDESVRRATRSLLEMLGYQVTEAHDGLQAVDTLRANPGGFDAVLLDVVMPRQGGRATLPQLRTIRELPVIVTTGTATAEDRDEWIELGAHALLAKPYDLADLSCVLAELVSA